jgi:hypothetical protein
MMDLMAQRAQQPDLLDTLSYGRIGLGVSLMLAPSLTGRTYLGRVASQPVVRFLLRVFGIRDLVVGALQLSAKGDKDATRRVIVAGIACDTVDALAAYVGREAMPRWGRRLVLLAATSAVAGGAVALAQLED